MPRVPISNLDDARLAVYRELNKHKLSRWHKQFIAEGEKVVQRLLESRFPVESVLAADASYADIAPRTPAHVPIYTLSQALLEQVVGFNFHRGVLAAGRRLRSPQLEEVLPREAAELTVVACVKVESPDNLASILRTAHGLGVQALLLGPNCADPYSRRVVRVSMGAALQLPIVESQWIERDLIWLRERQRMELVATVLDTAAEPLEQARFGPRKCLILGNEGHGLADEIQMLCSRRITITMAGAADSLNVATAAGIFLYHAQRVQ